MATKQAPRRTGPMILLPGNLTKVRDTQKCPQAITRNASGIQQFPEVSSLIDVPFLRYATTNDLPECVAQRHDRPRMIYVCFVRRDWDWDGPFGGIE